MVPEFADIIHTGSCATFLRTAALFYIYLSFRGYLEKVLYRCRLLGVFWHHIFGSRLPEIEREYRNELFREAETGNLLQR